jgi:hypothetical protein
MAKFLLWCILLVFSWPLALLALILYPIVWVLMIPFRLVGIAVEGVLQFIRAIILCLPECCAARELPNPPQRRGERRAPTNLRRLGRSCAKNSRPWPLRENMSSRVASRA